MLYPPDHPKPQILDVSVTESEIAVIKSDGEKTMDGTIGVWKEIYGITDGKIAKLDEFVGWYTPAHEVSESYEFNE